MDAPYKSSASQYLVFFPAIDDVGAEKFTWKNGASNTFWSVDGDRLVDEEIPLLVIPAQSLQSSTDYHFELTVKNSDDTVRTWKNLLFTTNSPPSSGQATMKPASGKPLKTSFTLSVPDVLMMRTVF